MTDSLNIAARLNDIASEIGAVAKVRSGQGLRYKFRGIEDAYLAIGPLLAKHGVTIIPSGIEGLTVTDIETSNGKKMRHAYGVFLWTLLAADGSSQSAATPGEGMDTLDKALAKASSIAYKYLIWNTFCVATEEQIDDDPDRTQTEPQSRESATADADEPKADPLRGPHIGGGRAKQSQQSDNPDGCDVCRAPAGKKHGAGCERKS